MGRQVCAFDKFFVYKVSGCAAVHHGLGVQLLHGVRCLKVDRDQDAPWAFIEIIYDKPLMHPLFPSRPTRARGAGGGRRRGFGWLCIFITFFASQWLKFLIYCEYRKVITTMQQGHTTHSSLCTKSSVPAGTASLAANLSSRSVWSSSTSI